MKTYCFHLVIPFSIKSEEVVWLAAPETPRPLGSVVAPHALGVSIRCSMKESVRSKSLRNSNVNLNLSIKQFTKKVSNVTRRRVPGFITKTNSKGENIAEVLFQLLL